MRLGIFGGTFDPPHLGHLILAAEAHDQLALDRQLFVITPDPPHKFGQRISQLEDRYNMLRAATADNPDFELSQVDIDRPPPHFAVDTVLILARQFPGAELVYLMGGDSLRDLPTWHDPQGFINAIHSLGVMRRPGDHVDLSGLDDRLPGAVEKVRFVDAPLLEIASSEIRERAAQGRQFRYYLPPPVYQYIIEHRLYQDEPSWFSR
jgi:nicotinate-nucleotide adenylyltransferase